MSWFSAVLPDDLWSYDLTLRNQILLWGAYWNMISLGYLHLLKNYVRYHKVCNKMYKKKGIIYMHFLSTDCFPWLALLCVFVQDLKPCRTKPCVQICFNILIMKLTLIWRLNYFSFSTISYSLHIRYTNPLVFMQFYFFSVLYGGYYFLKLYFNDRVNIDFKWQHWFQVMGVKICKTKVLK